MKSERRLRLTHKHGPGHLVVGLFLIFIGVVFLLDAMNLIEARLYVSRFWPVIFIVIGLSHLIQPGNSDRKRGLFWLVIGVLLLANRSGLLGINVWRMFWPVMLICLGIFMLFRSTRLRAARGDGNTTVEFAVSSSPDTTDKATDPGDRISAMAILGGVERKCTSQRFRGGDITTFLGGCKIDLRSADLSAGDATLDVFSMIGGIEIHVPPDWAIDSKVVPILGGYEDKTHPPKDATKRLSIQGTIILGGIQIKV